MRLVVLGALVAIALPSSRALAFVRETTRGTPPQPLFWRQACVPVTIYLNGFDTSPNKEQLPLAAIVKSVTEAAHAWSGDVVSCPSGGAPYLEIVPTLAPIDAKAPPVGYDGENTIVFRTDDWPYDTSALAKTTPHQAADGHLLDVDIEINATDGLKKFMSLDPGVVPPARSSHVSDGIEYFDLQTALTHEFGHFIGLDHTCFKADKGETSLEDDRGHATPNCDNAPAEIVDTVMYALQSAAGDPGPSVKRALSSDEIRAMCAIYAPTKFHAACPLDTVTGGCAVVPPPRRGPGLAPVAFAAFAALVGVALRRRRRPSDRARARS